VSAGPAEALRGIRLRRWRVAFSLGESSDLIAYPGDHTAIEAPPLTAGRQLEGPNQTEAGAGLAEALGLSPGSRLAIAFPSGAEQRLRVSGIVSSLNHDGRVAFVPAAALLSFGVTLELVVLGPGLSNLAASYATLPLGATVVEIGAVLAGLAVAAIVAVLWVARLPGRESVVAGPGS
jgi:hypothetical protein